MSYIAKDWREEEYIDQLSKFVKNYMENVSFENISVENFKYKIEQEGELASQLFRITEELNDDFSETSRELKSLAEQLCIDAGEIDELIANKELFDEIWETAYEEQKKIEKEKQGSKGQ